MAGVRTKKKPEEPPKGAPSYMLTYGDMTTLLLVFFVFLFQVTEGVSEARVDAAISSFRNAMGVFPSSISVLRPDEVLLVPKERGTKDFWGPEKQLAQYEKVLREKIKEMKDMKPGDLVYVKGKKELRLRVGAKAVFPAGSADIQPQFLESLDKIAEFAKTNKMDIIVEGHTDDRPISSAVYPSNWELSVGRASRVIRYFNEKHGIPKEKLSASGYADTRPIGNNNTPEGREQNRRIEIILKPTKESPRGFEQKVKYLFGESSLD